jgi:hypothetical protein
MKNALRQLLDRLDAIRKDHPELADAEVREMLASAIYHGFVLRTPGYSLPESLGLNSPEGNAALRIALADFLDAAVPAGARTPEQRFAVFQDPTVESQEGHCYDWYFGYAPSFPDYVAARSRAKVVRPAAPKPSGAWWQFWKRSDPQSP